MMLRKHRSFAHRARSRQRGIALPVMLIMLLVMLITGIYLLRSSNSTSLATASQANDAVLIRSVDFGLHSAFEWLKKNKAVLGTSSQANGYSATMAANASPSDGSFWTNAVKVTAKDNVTKVEYVIHRMCTKVGPFKGNTCMQTVPHDLTLARDMPQGTSTATDTPDYLTGPQVQYVITARIANARGGNVVSQMLVLIGV